MDTIKAREIGVKNISWATTEALVKNLCREIDGSGYKPDVIIAITRGGLPAGVLISDYFGALPVYTITTSHWSAPGKQLDEAIVTQDFSHDLSGKKVLLFDDISDTGKSIIVAGAHISKKNTPAEIRTATLQYASDTSTLKPDYYAEGIRKIADSGERIWWTYPWTKVEDTISLVGRLLRKDGTLDADSLTKKFVTEYGTTPPVEIDQRILRMARRDIL